MSNLAAGSILIPIPEKFLHTIYRNNEAFASGYEEYILTPLAGSIAPIKSKIINSSYFQCPICQMIARNPIEVPCCKHWYCCSCFMKYAQNPASKPSGFQPWNKNLKCAICRTIFNPIKTNNCASLHRAIQYNNIEVLCSFGCGKNGKISEISQHEELECGLRPIHCPFPKCSLSGPANTLSNHFSVCPFRSMYCPNCRLPVQLNKFSSHNCITALQNLVQNLKSEIERANKVVKQDCLPGPGGELVLLTRKSFDIKNPMEEYCQEYNKNPSKRPYELAQATPIWKKFKFSFRRRVEPRVRAPIVVPPTGIPGPSSQDNNSFASTTASSEPRAPEYSRQNAREITTDESDEGGSFTTANPDDWSIAGTDGSETDQEINPANARLEEEEIIQVDEDDVEEAGGDDDDEPEVTGISSLSGSSISLPNPQGFFPIVPPNSPGYSVDRLE